MKNRMNIFKDLDILSKSLEIWMHIQMSTDSQKNHVTSIN